MNKKKKDTIEWEGKVLASLGNNIFQVQLAKNSRIVNVTVTGALRAKIVQGDKVLLAMSIYDPMKGWIIQRLK